MRKPIFAFMTGLGLLSASAFTAEAQVSVQISAPTVTVTPPTVVIPPPPQVVFQAPPPLVVVEPGIQVVPDSNEEIYFVDNAYWLRRGKFWYRSEDHRGGWTAVRAAPRGLVRIKAGKYRKWHPRGPRREVVAAPPGTVVVAPPRPGVVVVAPGGPHEGRGHGRGHGKHRHD